MLRRKFGRSENEIQRIVRILASSTQIVQPQSVLQVVGANPTHNRILECAEAGSADLIVSTGHHLLDLGTYGKIPIIAGPGLRRGQCRLRPLQRVERTPGIDFIGYFGHVRQYACPFRQHFHPTANSISQAA